MSSPLILVNLKTFKEGMGNRGHMIANAAQLVAHESGVTIGIAPSYMDLHPLCHHFAIPVYAQHVDGFEPGAHTGHITVDALRVAGAAGSLINHSERRLTLAEIEASVRALQAQKLISVVCSNNESTSAGAAALAPGICSDRAAGTDRERCLGFKSQPGHYQALCSSCSCNKS